MNTLSKTPFRLASLILLIAFLGLNSCKKDETPGSIDPCASADPFSSLPWLAQQRQTIGISLMGGFITRYSYHDEFVFLVNDCRMCADYPVTYYDCNGDTICTSGGFSGTNDCPADFDEELKCPEVLFEN